MSRGARIGLLIGLLAACPAVAAESAVPPTFCAAPPAVPVASRSSVPGVRWRDLELSLLLLVGLAGAISYVVRNERRRVGGTRDQVEWTPYAAGAALGAVFACSMLVFGHPIGVSAGVQEAARWFERLVEMGPAADASSSWPLWVLVGVVVGGAASGFAGGGTSSRPVTNEGQGGRTWLVAFVAGLLLQIAADVAGGCTSGLALSGGMVLAPASFIFMAGMFLGGIPTARLARWRSRRRAAK